LKSANYSLFSATEQGDSQLRRAQPYLDNRTNSSPLLLATFRLSFQTNAGHVTCIRVTPLM